MMTRTFIPGDERQIAHLAALAMDACYQGLYLQQTIDGLRTYHDAGNILSDVEKGAYVVVVEDDGLVVGTGTLAGTYVKRVFVHPAYQRRGIGDTVMNMMEAEVGRSGFPFVELYATLPSEAFYLKRGYTTIYLYHNPGDKTRLEYFRMIKTSSTAVADVNIDGSWWRVESAAAGMFLGDIREPLPSIQVGGCVYFYLATPGQDFAEMIGVFTGGRELWLSAYYIEMNREWKSGTLILDVVGDKGLGNGIVSIARVPAPGGVALAPR